jgi:hypothetical protein
MHLFEQPIRRITEFLPQLVRQRQHEAIEKIVNALLPEVSISGAALAQARMMVEAKTTILNSGDLVPAGEFPKRRAAGFTLLAGWCLTGNLRLGHNPTGVGKYLLDSLTSANDKK